MGSQLTSLYTISEESASTGGPGNLWKIYSAVKKSSETPVTLFTLEKKRFEKESKTVREEIFNAIRKEVKTLAKLRHPSILHVVEPLEEDSKLMYFASEPVDSSLKFIIDTPAKRVNIPSEIELKTQLLDFIQTVAFLHNNAHLLHLDISPENVYLTPDGKLKIAGFFFSQPYNTPDATIPSNIDYSSASPNAILPHFAFTAPEVVREGMASAASDAFSVGCLIFNLLQIANNGKSLCFFDIGDRCTRQAYLDEIVKAKLPSYLSGKLSGLSPGAINLLSKLLVLNPVDRLKLGDAHVHEWFNDPRIKTLEYLEHLNEKEQQHKLQFLSGLSRVLGEFDNKVIIRRILPLLASYLQIDKISAHVLPPMITILEKENVCSKADFYLSVWPYLEAMCKGKEISAQALYLIIKHTDIWLRLVNIPDFQASLLVLYQKGIDCGVTKIQEHAISIIPTFAKKIEYATLKNMLLPKVLRLAYGTQISSLRIKCVESLSNFSVLLDSTVIKNAVMPTLEALVKADTDGKLQLTIVKTVESFLKIFAIEELATKVVPLLLNISVTGQFTKSQFTDVMNLAKKLIDNIENTRSKELQEIAASSSQEKTASPTTDAKKDTKKKKPEMDKGDKDVFDFLNQLGSKNQPENETKKEENDMGIVSSSKTPENKKVPEAKTEVKKEQKQDDWDMVFNIGSSSNNSKEATPASNNIAKNEEPFNFDSFQEPKKPKEISKAPAKTIAPPPKSALAPMKLTATKPQANDLDFLNLGAGSGKPASGNKGGLEDIDWGNSQINQQKTNGLNKPVASNKNFGILSNDDDPFAELESGGNKKDQASPILEQKPKTGMPPPVQNYNPFGGKKQVNEVKKQPANESIDDFFAELSKK